ncbi:MAG TPA: vWA domain-containing protein [Polyangiaceae bacterium]|nr:vWA domain-containing protein [Polyangiaceae bacterium]
MLSSFIACHEVEHAPLPPDSWSSTPDNAGAAPGILIPPTTSHYSDNCGGEALIALTEAPIVYFVLDRSGSMAEATGEDAIAKYDAACGAVGDLLEEIGHRVRFGAAIYPANETECDSGVQIFAPTLGDAPASHAPGERGPILINLLKRLRSEIPSGSTPTAAALRRTLALLTGQGKAFVVLITDGAPNCGLRSCDPDACIPDIESVRVDDATCGVDFSCCDPKYLARGSIPNCVDADASESAVAGLARAGIPTYVVGMPGSEVYAQLLERMAVAGGTAQEQAETGYFAVSDRAGLQKALAGIGAQVSLGCRLELTTAPQDLALVNVYLDGNLVGFDEADGWSWLHSAVQPLENPQGGAGGQPEMQRSQELVLELHGEACRALEAGEVRKVEITYGCQTVVR